VIDYSDKEEILEIVSFINENEHVRKFDLFLNDLGLNDENCEEIFNTFEENSD